MPAKTASPQKIVKSGTGPKKRPAKAWPPGKPPGPLRRPNPDQVSRPRPLAAAGFILQQVQDERKELTRQIQPNLRH